MLIVVDIGNTAIKFGFAENSEIVSTFALPSPVGQHSVDSIGLQLMSMLSYANYSVNDVESVYISSVVPMYDAMFEEVAHKYLKTKVNVIGKNCTVPLENAYENPSEVGADRLVGAYAARKMFPDERIIISVDFGTATTFDCVKDNTYLGGLICPGVLSSHAALSEKAAKLPRIALEVESGSIQIGKNTATSISHGFVFGFSAMTQGLITNLSQELVKEGEKAFVLATGGFASSIAKHVSIIDTVEQNLVLIGLVHLHINNKK